MRVDNIRQVAEELARVRVEFDVGLGIAHDLDVAAFGMDHSVSGRDAGAESCERPAARMTLSEGRETRLGEECVARARCTVEIAAKCARHREPPGDGDVEHEIPDSGLAVFPTVGGQEHRFDGRKFASEGTKTRRGVTGLVGDKFLVALESERQRT